MDADEGGWEGVHWLCCTWEGLDRLKRGVALCTGAAVLTASVLTLLNPADTTFKPVSFVRSCWNALFGLLMILVQCRGSRWSATRASPPSRPTNWIKRRFGFMSGWFGRALFFLFVGTNIVEPDSPSAATAMLTIVTGVACLFVGAVELLFGFRCAERGDGNEGPTGSGNNAASEPSPNTNAPGHQSSFARVFGGGTRGVQEPQSTPARDEILGSLGAAGPSWAAQAPPPVVMGEPTHASPSQAVEGTLIAAAAAPPANSSAEPNPFYGNSHLPGP